MTRSLEIEQLENVTKALQEWLDEAGQEDNLEFVANFIWSDRTANVLVNDVTVYDDQNDGSLTLEVCKANWLEHCRQYIRFVPAAKLDIVAIQALKDIVNPLAALERDLEPNQKIDGQMAIKLLDDPKHYQDIAHDALKRLGLAVPKRC